MSGAVQGGVSEEKDTGGAEKGADPSAATGEGAAGGGMIDALMKPPVHDGSAGRGVHPDGSLVQDWEYFDNFFKRYNKVRRCAWGCWLWHVSRALRVPEVVCRTRVCIVPASFLSLAMGAAVIACLGAGMLAAS